MNHRHLLPEEIDQLLDDEEGFGVAPLRSHLAECPTCTEKLAALSQVVLGLESLPHVAPPSRFADRVMEQVHIFEPWHVSLRDSMRRWIPTSFGGRVLAGATGGVMAVVLTVAVAWIGRRADAMLFLGNLVMERTREGLASAVVKTATTLLGEGPASVVQGGGRLAVLAASALLVVAVAGVALGLKAVATAGRRRRA